MDEFDNDVMHSAKDSGDDSEISSTLIIWGIAAVVLSILMIINNTSGLVLGAGGFQKSIAVICGIVIGTLGALLGDALRRFARPNSVFTRGGFFQLIWIKVFWSIGPQCIGLVIGVSLGESLILMI